MKKKTTRKKKPAPPAQAPVELTPPPDDPLHRHEYEAGFDARAMAEKRLEAVRQIRKQSGSPKPPDQ